MAKDDATLTKLLGDVDKAKAEIERLFKEAMAKPRDNVLHQRLWDVMEREKLARRSVLRHTGG